LNDDDALDLFKKTLSFEQAPRNVASHSFGMLQLKVKKSPAARAHDMIEKTLAMSLAKHKPQLELIELRLKAKKVDFSKILAMIEGMVEVLHEEQKDDDTQKAFCDVDIEKSTKEKKDTEESVAASQAFIEETTAESAAAGEEIVALGKAIKDLDKAVAEATEQRKEEHAEFLVFQQQSSAALQLVEKAKNRLMKFYKPAFYKEAPTTELSDDEKIFAMSGRSDLIATAAPEYIAGTTQTVYAQIRSHREVPPPPPETWGAYQKKEGKSSGVMALMDMLLKELGTDISDAENEEKTSQKDYERLMADSQVTRHQNAASITDKEAAKADMDTAIEETKAKLDSQQTSLANLHQYILQLHASCDFLVENYDLRKAARENELTSLATAKSTLSGANME
jgi:hypothetical protein